PPTTHKVPEGNVLHMPFNVALIQDGHIEEKTLELKSLKESFTFKTKDKPILSLNRNFSAPVLVEYPYTQEELLHLMIHDNDAYGRYEATQQVYDWVFKTEFNQFKASGKLSQELNTDFKLAFESLLK